MLKEEKYLNIHKLFEKSLIQQTNVSQLEIKNNLTF